jgi:hypothetical protein
VPTFHLTAVVLAENRMIDQKEKTQAAAPSTDSPQTTSQTVTMSETYRFITSTLPSLSSARQSTCCPE